MLKTPPSKMELAILPAIAGTIDGPATLLGQQALIVFFSLANYRMAVWVSRVITGLHVFGVATWLVRVPFGLIWVVLLGSAFRFGVYPRYKLPSSH